MAKLRDVKGWFAWIVGGPQRAVEQSFFSSLQEQARFLGLLDRVRFLGYRADVARLMRSADIYSQPNDRHPEPFGLSFVEALKAGLPVVSTAMGGVPEIVDDNCAVLVEPSSADALAHALRRLVIDGDCRLKMATSARQRAQAFAPEQRMKELVALLARFHLERQGKTSEAKGRPW